MAGPTVTLVRGEAPSARTLFPDTPVVPPEIWVPLQAKRVRYFPKHPVKPGVVPKPPPGGATTSTTTTIGTATTTATTQK
jgi:hypothetical protein